MKAIIHHWPELPSLPPAHQPVLVRVVTASDRRTARQLSREVLREILAAWSGVPADQLPLAESPRGPIWSGTLHGESLALSLSYTENEIWIALLRGGRIGIDAMPLQSFPEIESVAQNFFPPSIAAAIQQSKNPAHAFASAWTALEARVKCLGQDLTEWSPARDAALATCHDEVLSPSDNILLTLATASPVKTPPQRLPINPTIHLSTNPLTPTPA
jgi:4'-phosphopantetheinyl transferase